MDDSLHKMCRSLLHAMIDFYYTACVNSLMTGEETEILISAAGGDAAFARLLGIADQAWAAQRVNNWKTRGLPSAVELEHYDTIQDLRAQVSRDAKRARRENA